jgi:hypothetical protein
VKLFAFVCSDVVNNNVHWGLTYSRKEITIGNYIRLPLLDQEIEVEE